MDHLLQTSLMGTGQATLPALQMDDPFEDLAARISESIPDQSAEKSAEKTTQPISVRSTGTSPERSLLIRVGFQAVAARAGAQPHQIQSPMQGPVEVLKAPSAKLTELLSKAFDPQLFVLMEGFLGDLASAGIHLPHRLIPNFLDLESQSKRRAVFPTLSERAKWISRFAPNWSWVSEGLIEDQSPENLRELWDEAPIFDRIKALIAMRQRDRTTADAWLLEAFPQEKADYRKRLVEAMSQDLQPSDVPILTPLLKDRSKDVRDLALESLFEFPDSEVSQKLQNRSQELFWEQNPDQSWKLRLHHNQDVLDEALSLLPDRYSKLDRDVQVRHIVARLPADFWLKQRGIDVDQLLEQIKLIKNSEPILLGLMHSGVRFAQRDPLSITLLEPLIPLLAESMTLNQYSQRDEWLSFQQIHNDIPPGLWNGLTRHILRLAAQPQFGNVIGHVEKFPAQWSPEFSKEFLATTRKAFLDRSDSGLTHWQPVLSSAAVNLHPETLVDALGAWEINTDFHAKPVSGMLINRLKEFGEMVKTRIEFREEVQRIVQNS